MFRDKIILKLYSANIYAVEFFSTIFCRLKMIVWGICYGKRVKFVGNTIFFKAPSSSIIIGDDCFFVSTSHANFRGINHKCIIETRIEGARIKIGRGCGLSGVSIVADRFVSIGNNVLVGANCIIGDRDDHGDKYPQCQPKPVIIKDKVWLGMNVVVLKGVTIGENTIIGANSIVTNDIPANCVAAGVPCRIIKTL